MTEFEEPSEKEYQKLFAWCNLAPPLTSDSHVDPAVVLVGVFDRDGELRSADIRKEDLGMPECPGVKVSVFSHTESVEDLRKRWRRAA